MDRKDLLDKNAAIFKVQGRFSWSRLTALLACIFLGQRLLPRGACFREYAFACGVFCVVDCQSDALTFVFFLILCLFSCVHQFCSPPPVLCTLSSNHGAGPGDHSL